MTVLPPGLEIVPGTVYYAGAIADPDRLLADLRAALTLQRQAIDFGRGPVPLPRLTAWYGDPDAVYTYSGIRNVPQPWPACLDALREELTARFLTGTARLNSCLVNFYRSGQDSIGWHSDGEPELEHLIVSVSLGVPRRFLLRPRRARHPVHALLLAHGSVMTMTVASQRGPDGWQHALPKDASVSGERLNLTFRTVRVPPDR